MACMYCGSEDHSSMGCPVKDQDVDDAFEDDDNESIEDDENEGVD
jgi:hypothetical protein